MHLVTVYVVTMGVQWKEEKSWILDIGIKIHMKKRVTRSPEGIWYKE